MIPLVAVSASAAPGGAERALLNVLVRMPSRGIEPTAVLLAEGPFAGQPRAAGCHVEILEAGRTRQLHRAAFAVSRIKEMIVARGGAVVLSNQSKSHVYGGLAAIAARRPAVWWQHGIPSRSSIELAAAKVPAQAVFCASPGAEIPQRLLTPRVPVLPLMPGTDLAGVRAASGSGGGLRAHLGWATKEIVGIVGRMEPWKGHDTFLDAAAVLVRTRPNARFVVVGGAVLGWEGDVEQRLADRAARLGLGDKVRFVGQVEDVYPWFDACDVVVHASADEPFGLVIVEAMALGRPFVATDGPGPNAILGEALCEQLIAPNDPTAMATAIDRLLAEPGYAVKVGATAFERAERFGADRTADDLAHFLHGTADDGSATGGMSDAGMASVGTHRTAASLIDARPGVVLDIGPGHGAFSLRLHALGGVPVAVGNEPDRFGCHGRVPFVAADLDCGLPFDVSSVGAVVAIEVIEHLEAPLPMIREISRVLRPGGFAVITTPNLSSLSSKASTVVRGYPLYFGDHEYRTNGHISPISLRQIEAMADRSGLVVEFIGYSEGSFRFRELRHWGRAGALPLRSGRWGESVIVKLRKPRASSVL